MMTPPTTEEMAVSPRTERRLAAAIVALFVLLSVTYSVVAPLLESPDESRHYPYVKHLADGYGLPVQDPANPGPWEQEGSQPPLYYMVAAALTHWIDTDDMDEVRWLNPHARIGLPMELNNKNLIIHTERERFPWRGTVLAVHLIRLFSVTLGAGTVLCTRALARRLLPGRPAIALGAMALNAAIPTFAFISGSVNNDNLVTFLASLVLVLLVGLVQRGTTPWRLLAVGALIGLASLTKLSGLALIPLAFLALALRGGIEAGLLPESAPRAMDGDAAPCRRRAARTLVVRGVLLIVPVVLIAGWWYLRNATLYGDPLGLRPMLDIVGRRSNPPTGLKLLSEFQGLRISFWALFGAVNVLLRPTWIYYLLDGVSVLAALGLALGAWRARRVGACRWLPFVVPVVWAVVVFVALTRWTSMTMASQGRLLFPAIAAITLLFVLGLAAWAPVVGGGRRARMLGLGLLAILALISATAPFVAIAPAYRRPAIISAADVPVSARPINATFDGKVRLLAYEIHTPETRPGGYVEVGLYWEAVGAMAEDYSIAIHLFGRDREPLGQTDSYPAGGSYPTSLWTPGEALYDVFRVPVRAGARAPAAASIEVGLYRLATFETLPAVDAAGNAVNPVSLGRVKMAGSSFPTTPDHPLEADLDGRVRLVGYDLSADTARPGGTLDVALHWRVTGRLDDDYTVFLQLLDADGEIVGQGDGPPMGGDYPTSLWAPGEALVDHHRLQVRDDAAPGTCRIIVGLYNLATGQRLPIVGGGGQPSGDHVELAAVRVEAE